MRYKNFFISTKRNTPSDVEIISHQLMLRAGFIKPLAAGLYCWSPIGLRVLKKVEKIVRQCMNNAGAQELLMTSVQPAELWQKSGRWQQYGPELLRFQDRHQRDFCLAPTHEEVVTDMFCHFISSYRQLPLTVYQIQTKFRDEIRPRFGIMRAREFIMKDAYSFHLDKACLKATYQNMINTYSTIFNTLGLKFCMVAADSGNIGGNVSHEFHILAKAGEDMIALSDETIRPSEYAANAETISFIAPKQIPAISKPLLPLKKVSTPNCHTLDDAAQCLHTQPRKVLKMIMLQVENQIIAVALRGDHQLNLIKVEKYLNRSNIKLCDADTLKQSGHSPGAIGCIGLKIRLLVDYAATQMTSFYCGANEPDYHYAQVDWQRDVGNFECADLRLASMGDPCPDGSGQLKISRGIEVGHVFQLEDKYSQAMSVTMQDDTGQKQPIQMGCYGIGISRIVAASIEQNHDDYGIVWPAPIAPFQLALIPIAMEKERKVAEYCEQLYQQLIDAGIEVLYFNHAQIRLGEILTDVELMGIPHQLLVGKRSLANNTVHYAQRASREQIPIDCTKALPWLIEKMKH